LYELFPLSTCETLLGGPWSFNYYASCDGHNSYKYPRQALAFACLLPPHKYKPREGSDKILYKCETWYKYAISNSKPQIALLMVKPNTNEEVKNPITPTPYHANCDELIHEFTIGNPCLANHPWEWSQANLANP